MGFNEKVWSLAKRIPRGKVTTYKILAGKLGTRAYRAVGNALNKNPYSPEVPCHRVVKSDGEVGGFARGAKRKIIMLEREGLDIKKDRISDFDKVLFRF